MTDDKGTLGTVDSKPIPVGYVASWSGPRPVPTELFAVYVDPPAVGLYVTATEADAAERAAVEIDHGNNTITRATYRRDETAEPAPERPGVRFREVYAWFSHCPVPLPDGEWHMLWWLGRSDAEAAIRNASEVAALNGSSFSGAISGAFYRFVLV